MRCITYTITKEYSNRPLLHFLKGELKLSTHIVQSLRHTNGAVLINGIFARVVDIVNEGDNLEIHFPEKTQPPLLWEKELEIIFEDMRACADTDKDGDITILDATQIQMLIAGLLQQV